WFQRGYGPRTSVWPGTWLYDIGGIFDEDLLELVHRVVAVNKICDLALCQFDCADSIEPPCCSAYVVCRRCHNGSHFIDSLSRLTGIMHQLGCWKRETEELALVYLLALRAPICGCVERKVFRKW